MHSERPKHRMYEQYHPLGIVGVISVFNFPAAVWAWNKLSHGFVEMFVFGSLQRKHRFVRIVCQNIIASVLKKKRHEGVGLINGDRSVGERLMKDPHCIDFTVGSTNMGRSVGQEVAKRFGKTI